MDEEILQDFLVEAADLVEQLNEQLADLENSPTDSDLLNAVFRGFHTIKGGAGFLAITPLIEVCHRAENVFDKIRNGDVDYDATAVEVILRAFDVISDILEQLNNGEREFADNDPELLAQLDALTGKKSAPVQEPTANDSATTESALQLAEGVDPDGDMSDEEFEALLNQRDAQPKEVDSPPDVAPVEPKPDPKPKSKPAVDKKAKPATKSNAESTVRVDTKRVDEIMNLVGELVLVRNRLLTLKGKNSNHEDLANAVANLDHVTTDLQASVLKTRMQPVKKVFGRFPRVVRDLARKLGKDITLELKGEETDLDKNLVEALADPLVHLVRNSVDHGVEMPDVRAAAGKPKTGTVVLAAQQEGDHILLSITDDGKGMDPDVLRQKAVEKGMMDEQMASQLDDKSAFELILSAGFSTADVVSDISGRGVGMDVVKTMITKLNGSIEIHSVLGEGTKISIRVPLTLAILPTLMVGFDEDSYAIPLTSVQEIFDFNPEKTNKIDGQMMVRLREESVPLYFLNEWLAADKPKDNYRGDKVVIVSVGNQRAGLVVNQVNGQEEVVIKPLGVMLKKALGYAGATITGNGSIALILDLQGVVKRFQ
ncbi:MAG: chemotaxis protein CheA [Thiomicrorhabdus sp.]|nr:chemotaxis protein CheA [Thiomicrorhabdus sp.]